MKNNQLKGKKGGGKKEKNAKVQKKQKKEESEVRLEISQLEVDWRDSLAHRGDILAKVGVYEDRREEFLVAGDKRLSVVFSVY